MFRDAAGPAWRTIEKWRHVMSKSAARLCCIFFLGLTMQVVNALAAGQSAPDLTATQRTADGYIPGIDPTDNGWQLGQGKIPPSAMQRLLELRQQMIGNNILNDAYNYLVQQPYALQLEIIQNPQNLQALGFNLDLKQQKDLAEMLHMQEQHRQQARENIRNENERTVENHILSLIAPGQKNPDGSDKAQDWIGAQQYLTQAEQAGLVSGHKAYDIRKALQDRKYNTDDHRYLDQIRQRALNDDYVFPDELALASMEGKISHATAKAFLEQQDAVFAGLAMIQKDAEQGIAKAQFTLGKMYYNGHVMPKDVRVAAHWLQKAAQQGEAKSQFLLGTMYLLGQGVVRDQQTACDLLRASAEQGDKMAIGRYNQICAKKND